jgi:hypothetical protein
MLLKEFQSFLGGSKLSMDGTNVFIGSRHRRMLLAEAFYPDIQRLLVTF